jgi:hypothetical protein
VPHIKLYVDEDAMDADLIAALRARGVDVITALDADLIGQPDDAHLAFATQEHRALYTCNVCDFYQLHTQWAGIRDHAGLILVPQQRYSVGEQLRRILRLRAKTSTETMWNNVEFLSNWG